MLQITVLDGLRRNSRGDACHSGALRFIPATTAQTILSISFPIGLTQMEGDHIEKEEDDQSPLHGLDGSNCLLVYSLTRKHA